MDIRASGYGQVPKWKKSFAVTSNLEAEVRGKLARIKKHKNNELNRRACRHDENYRLYGYGSSQLTMVFSGI